MNLMKRGRKWVAFVTVVVFCSTILAMSFLLALLGKLTSDWSTLCQILSAAVSAAAVAYTAGNSYVTGKGAAPPPESTSAA